MMEIHYTSKTQVPCTIILDDGEPCGEPKRWWSMGCPACKRHKYPIVRSE